MAIYDIPIIEVQNIKKATLCVFSEVEDYPLYDIESEEKLNDVRKLRFNVNARNPKSDYLINENILEYDGNEYIIITRALNDDNDSQYYSIEAFGIEYILTSRYNGKLDFIGATIEEMMAKVLEGSGFGFGGTNVTDKRRHLISEDTCIMDNLVNMADVFDCRLEFKTTTVDNVVRRTVSLYEGYIDRGRYIEKGRDLIGTSIEYQTEEMVTKLYVFGQNDKVTGFPISMIDKNPTGKSYVEDYSYYTDMGFTLEEIKDNPQFTKELIVQNNDLIDSDACYNFAVDEIKRLSKPLITCTANIRDLHQIKAYLVSKPTIGEQITIYDYDINLEATAIIVGTNKKHNNPEESTFEISNVIVNNASFTKSYNDASKDMNKIFDSEGKLNGGNISDGSIGSIQIGDAVINNAHINNLHADKITAGDISAYRLTANTIDAINLYAGSAKINSAKIGNLSANHITSGTIDAEYIKGSVIEAINLYAGDATINGAKISDASIGNSHITKLSADKLDAGTIDTSRVKITGSDNAIEIIDGRIMVNDTTNLLKPINRVTMGKYIKNQATGELEYGLLVRSADGQTILIDGQGVHNAGITNGAIDDNKVSPDANINGSKLDIGSVITSINKDTGEEHIQSGKIYFDNKSLDVTFQEIKTKENEFATNIATNTSNISQNATQIGLKVSQQSYDVDKVNNTKRFETIEGEIKVNSDAIKLKVSQTEMESYVGGKVNKAVKSVDVYYAQSSSNTTVPTTGWVTALPSWQDNMYIWTKSITTYVDGTSATTTPVCLTATNGTDGKGIVSIQEQYYKSTSATQLVGGTWQNEPPTWEQFKYIWTRSIITYTTGEPTTTAPVCTTGSKGDDGVNGLSIIWKGELQNPPTNPQLNWCYKDTDNGIIYIWTGTIWEVMVVDGNNGHDGANGNDGLSVFITYHDSLTTPSLPSGNGTVGGWHTNATSSVVWMSQKISVNSTSGTWGTPIKIRGFDGSNGSDGVSITKVDVEYGVSNSSTIPPTIWSTSTPEWRNGYYMWSRTKTYYSSGNPSTTSPVCISGQKGSDGTNGSNGLNAKGLSLTASRYVVAYNSNNTIKDSTVITLTAIQQNDTTTVSWSTNPSVVLGGSGNTRTLDVSNFNSNNQIQVSVTASGLSDVITIAKVVDGNKGADGVNGANGQDAYTVLLSNESHIFAAGITNAIPSNTTCAIISYKGGNRVASTIGVITGQPNGLTTSVTSNGTTNSYITIDVTSLMNTKNGTLTIPITVDGKSFTKTFTYSLSLTGLNGSDGRSVKSITEEYYLSNSKTTQSGGTWQTTYPDWVKGKYVWTRSKIIYQNSDGTETTNYTSPVCDSSWDVANEVDVKVESLKSTVAAIDLELDSVTTRVSSVESRTTTVEGTITNHENRIKSAEQKITDDAIISTVSGTIDQKITNGTAGILADIAILERDVATANTNASNAASNASNALSQLNDIALDSALTPSEKQEVNRRWLEIANEKSGIIKQSEVYGISKTAYENAYSVLNTYLFGSSGILVGLSSTTNNIDIIVFNSKFDGYYTQRQVILDGVAQKSKEYADTVKSQVEQNISDTTQEIKQSYETAIKQEADKIINSVEQSYSTKGETTSLDTTLRSLIEQTSKDITFNFAEATKYTKEVDGKLQETIDELQTYIRFDANGINLGEVGSPFTAMLGNEKLAFMQNGTEIAYISNNKMFITDVEVANKLRIGSFEFVPRSNGNMSLKWVN